jgi:hypothetical protein
VLDFGPKEGEVIMMSDVEFHRANLPHIAFVPGLYDGPELNETVALQRLAVFAIRGLYSETKRPQELHEIFQRVIRMVTAEISGKRWVWGLPKKRTLDRRVNETASTNPLDNNCTLTKDGKPRITMWNKKPGFYIPNPDVYEDVTKTVEARP